MNHTLLYLGAVLIWGSTWLAITFQLGTVAPAVSVAWRFWLASALMLAWARAKGQPLRFQAKDHGFLAAQGAFLFSTNFVLFYSAEQYVSSGLVAVVCSSMVFMNMLGARLCFKTPIAREVLVGAVLGITGIALVFWPELKQFEGSALGLLGLSLAIAATASASGGNLLSARNSRAGLPLIAATAVAMLYGAVFVTLYAWLTGSTFTVDWSPRYLGSLAYLAVFGSVAAFGCYLTLIARVGAERAGYVNVVVPLVALLLSTFFEAFEWKLETVLGMGLSLAGNVLVLRRARAPR